ncbi:hypothetical protein ACWCQ0_21345 [Streptomyces massasporeus]|uniref:Zinc-finger domain-containing protein n=1 Tax=Streptomyces massasporeus TaxID=67324 RepID=A0ABW6LBM7_9ACTN
MAHVESAHLLELALGNAAPGDDDAEALRHVEHCDLCRDELGMLIRLVTAARAAKAVDLPIPPPEHIWLRITREVSRGRGTPPPQGRPRPDAAPGS